MRQRKIKHPFSHHMGARSYDIVYLLKQAIEKAKVTGITGTNVCFDANGDAELPGYIIEMKGGKWTLFDQHLADKCKS